MAIGIIAEYNPFHSGHIHQLKEAKKRWPNEQIIIILSGKYVQRGELAVASFEQRSKVALEYGADKVIELPFQFATQGAHIFAEGAVLTAFDNGVDKLFFGSESDDVENLMNISHMLFDNQDQFNKELKKYLKMGNSFPKSAELALGEINNNKTIVYPNDILGLEYCKAIVKNNLPITPYTLKRTIEFHSEEAQQKFASASLIRKKIFNKEDVSQWTPMKFENIPDRIENHYKEFQKIVRNSTPEELREIKLISEGMENLFKKNIGIKTYDLFVNKVNSRRYTSSRIKRVMLHVLLGIKIN